MSAPGRSKLRPYDVLTPPLLVQDPLAMKILDGSVLPGDHVVVDADARSGQMKFERAAEKVSAEHSANGSASRAARRRG